MTSITRERAHTFERIVAKMLASSLPAITDLLYPRKVTGSESIDFDAAAVFAFRHGTWVDFLHATGFFRSCEKPIMIPAMERVFENQFIGSLLAAYGAVPIKRPQDEGYHVNSAAVIGQGRAFTQFLKQGGWYAYAPEGTSIPDRVGDKLQVHPLILGAKYGRAYIVGTVYHRHPPWLPGEVTLNIQRYSADGKSRADIAAEVRLIMEDLSGLEHRVQIAAALSPRNNR